MIDKHEVLKITKEPAQEFFCSQCGKQIPTNICNDCWYGQRECKRCSELEELLRECLAWLPYGYVAVNILKDKINKALEGK
jgi:hypothetical protein